jgi:hypothetical protein
MARQRKITYQNRLVEATEVQFQAPSEHWNEYLVDDGSVIKLKTVTSEVLRIEGEYDPEGNPIYLVKSTNIVTVSAPEKLRDVRGRRKRIQSGNETLEAIEIPFQTGGEHWNQYDLEDGSMVRLKTVTTEILRVEGKRDAEGNPGYVVKSRNIVMVSAPENLRLPPKGG